MSALITRGKPVPFNERECVLLVRLLAAVADGRDDEQIRDAARAGWTLLGHRVYATAGVANSVHPGYESLLDRIAAAVGDPDDDPRI